MPLILQNRLIFLSRLLGWRRQLWVYQLSGIADGLKLERLQRPMSHQDRISLVGRGLKSSPITSGSGRTRRLESQQEIGLEKEFQHLR
jgi:hypothetical protein